MYNTRKSWYNTIAQESRIDYNYIETIVSAKKGIYTCMLSSMHHTYFIHHTYYPFSGVLLLHLHILSGLILVGSCTYQKGTHSTAPVITIAKTKASSIKCTPHLKWPLWN